MNRGDEAISGAVEIAAHLSGARNDDRACGIRRGEENYAWPGHELNTKS